MSGKDSYIKDLEMETFDLIAKVIELINVIGWDDDDTYTFSDGDRWAKFDPEDASFMEDLTDIEYGSEANE